MPTEKLIRQFTKAFAGRQLFLVGGSLRDQFLHRPSSDLDFATDARPEEIRGRVESWADSVWLVGEKFGTVGVEKDGVKAEITTFRSDDYNGVSRKPQVAFGDDIRADLSRRDFTINAMARDLHRGDLLDPFGGQDDLRARVVRFVGDAAERIAEDPLRMLRAVRFCAQLDFALGPEAAPAIARSAKELPRISCERIRDELDRLLLSSHPADGLRLMVELGLAEHALPELTRLHLPESERDQIKDVLEHTLEAVDLVPAQKALRYAALLHDIAKPECFVRDASGVHFHRHEAIGEERSRTILSRLRQPAWLTNQVAHLVRHHLRIPYYRSEWSEAAVRRLMFDLGDQLESALALAAADVAASDPRDYLEFEERLGELRARIQRVGEAAELARMKPLLNGDEVMALLGLEPGPKVGEALDYLLDRQIDGEITSREEAIEALRSRFLEK